MTDNPLNFYNESVKYTKYNTTFNISKKEGINQLIMLTPSERNNESFPSSDVEI